MSASAAPIVRDARVADRSRVMTAVAGSALLGALALGLTPHPPAGLVVALAAAGIAVESVLLAPGALRALRRHRVLGLVVVLLGLAVAWAVSSLRSAGALDPFGSVPLGGVPDPFVAFPFSEFRMTVTDWPWSIGRLYLPDVLWTLLLGVSGIVLLADAVRIELGLVPAHRSPWSLMTARVPRHGRMAWRAVIGIGLVGVSAALSITTLNALVGYDSVLTSFTPLLVSAGAVLLIISPLFVGVLMRVDRDKAGRAREEERQRFAAHLHDSVLQTLALVQRQANDPAAVARLARRQEHALRAWMAGESELVSETLAAALREVVAGVEDEYGITIELTAIGDRPLGRDGEALVAAAREALRNAARHGAGAQVFVFAEISAARVDIFVRDQGPGFDADAVAAERRGIRDAIVGRMASAGGRATIESAPGEGTEVTLQLGPGGPTR